MELNIFGKLEEAQRLYLNPTLELIKKNITDQTPLNELCYYKLQKYPSVKTSFWDLLDQVITIYQKEKKIDLTPLLDWVQEITDKQYPARTHLISNLNLVIKNNDIDYLQYLTSHRPKRKLTMKLVRRRAIIEPDLAIQLGISETELNNLTTVKLKMATHKYIKNHQLQDESNVMIDDNLSDLLSVPTTSSIHYFRLLKLFNRKFVQRFENSSDGDK